MAPTGIINRSLLDDAFRGFNTVFDMAFLRAATNVDAVAMRVQSSGADEKYNWFGPAPKMREWIGDRAVEELSNYSQTIVNKDWANGLRVAANDIRDDKLGMVRPRIAALGEEAGFHQWDLIVAQLIAGFTTVCYDGQFFFDTDHVDGTGSAQSNKGTAALDATSYAAAWQAMMSIQDEKGSYLRIMPETLVVGPKLRASAMALVQAQYLAGGGTNINYQSIKNLIVEPQLNGTYDDYWFLIAGGGPIKPIVLQQREAVEFIQQDDHSSEGYFNRKEYRYGANWSGNVGYGLWQCAYGAIL